MNLLDALYLAAAGVTYPVWSRKTRGGWSERFGHVQPPPVNDSRKPRVMLHAVSVGEVSALRHMVPILREHADVIVTASTDTGIARARELYSNLAHVTRYPLDFSRSVERFLNAVRPDAVGLVELELWPNFVRSCVRRGIPVSVINGRLSERSFKGYRRIRPFIKRTFASLTTAAVQDESYAVRFRAMGVPADRCVITGSMKWDAATIAERVDGADELAESLGIDRSRPLIVAGSTGPGEEAMLHDACSSEAMGDLAGRLQLLCAPRKPERFDEAAASLPGCVRRSCSIPTGHAPSPAVPDALPPTSPKPPRASNRFLLDTIGELRKAYSLADVVVVGRSFGSQYGSDPIEPIGLGKATVIGPSVSDFQGIVSAFVQSGGIIQTDKEHLPAVLRDLLARSASDRQSMADRGRECIRQHQGSSARHARMLVRQAESAAGRIRQSS